MNIYYTLNTYLTELHILSSIKMTIFSFMLFNELYRFFGEIKTINFTVSDNENTTFGFSQLGTTFFLYFYEFSAKSIAQMV